MPLPTIISPPLNRLAKGLLDFFGIKAGTWGPNQLGQLLTPNIELLDWYTEPYAQTFNVGSAGGHAATNPGNSIEFAGATSDPTVLTAGVLQVPADEIWYVHNFHAQYSFPALENGSFLLFLTQAGNLTGTIVPPQQQLAFSMPFATGAPAAGGFFYTALQRKMFWQPGTQCHIVSCGLTALAGVIRGVGLVNRFKV